jgi:hypothetical protein
MTKVILKTRPMKTPTAAASLFGDLGLMVDRLLKGDKAIKEAIATADATGRGGYASLMYHLKKAGVTKFNSADDHIMRSLKMDQEYSEVIEADTQHIEQRLGRYRVQVMFEGNRFRKTFDTLGQARNWRDRLSLLFLNIEQSEAPPIDEDSPEPTDSYEKAAAARQKLINAAMQPNPTTGVIPSWAAVLRGLPTPNLNSTHEGRPQ